jgi:hypothetical protein
MNYSFISQDLDKRIESMTFENQALSEQKPSQSGAAGLIFLNTKETRQDTDDIDCSTRQFYNQTRKKQQNKSSMPSNQPQPITQSLRGLTNVRRTLYDPNAPAPKTPPVSVIQPITTVKVTPNPPPPPPLLPTNNQQQMQEFYQQ